MPQNQPDHWSDIVFGSIPIQKLIRREKTGFTCRRSGFSRLDARLKLIIVAVAVICNVAFPDYRLSLLLLLSAWGVMAVSGIPVRHAIWFILAPLWAALPVVLGFSVSLGITPLFTAGRLTIYQEGLAQGVAALLRVLVDTGWGGVLILTTPFTDIITALRRLRAPSLVVEVMGFMYRYLFLLWEEFNAMRTAARARGGLFGWFREWRTTGAIIAQVFMRAYDRGERIRQAMQARGSA